MENSLGESMLKTALTKLYRDKWSLSAVAVAGGICSVLISWTPQVIEFSTRAVFYVLLLVLGIIFVYFRNILPLRIYQKEPLGAVVWQYAGCWLIGESLFVYTKVFVLENNMFPVSIALNLITEVLFWGFVYAVAHKKSLWQGLGQMCSRHILKLLALVAVVRAALWLGRLMNIFPPFGFVSALWAEVVYIVAVYLAMPWLGPKEN